VARILGAPCVLDLEDGLIAGEEGGRAVVQRVMLRLYNRTCSTGILLACRDLATQVPFRSHYVCYGVAPQESPARLWQSPLQFHLGGALYRDTGTVLFLEALEILRRRYPETVPKVRFTVTGFGPMAGEVERIASSSPDGWLRFLGKVDEDTYGEILQRSHVGLCLKLPGSGMGATTFPSKVVDMAGHGLLILSTRVSDVPELFPPGSAMLLDNPGAEALAETIARITAEPELARKTAERGQELIRDRLSPEKVGKELRHFLFKVSERGGHPR
jgi:glycosyltransferase involved in cell wall biosynthesis